jgi:hypothetical protein
LKQSERFATLLHAHLGNGLQQLFINVNVGSYLSITVLRISVALSVHACESLIFEGFTFVDDATFDLWLNLAQYFALKVFH